MGKGGAVPLLHGRSGLRDPFGFAPQPKFFLNAAIGETEQNSFVV
jgi:hypothetical protein